MRALKLRESESIRRSRRELAQEYLSSPMGELDLVQAVMNVTEPGSDPWLGAWCAALQLRLPALHRPFSDEQFEQLLQLLEAS